MDHDEKRIMQVFGTKAIPDVNRENLLKYRAFLLDNLSKKCIITGREDFLWEEYYVIGPGDKTEYENLKKSRASYTDEYYLKDILADSVAENDLYAVVGRLSDKKMFELELSWLKVKNEQDLDYTLLEDFGVWAANW
jgi:hypothetical protein